MPTHLFKLFPRQHLNLQIHIFCLDFASALLANILHSNITIDYLENNHPINLPKK